MMSNLFKVGVKVIADETVYTILDSESYAGKYKIVWGDKSSAEGYTADWINNAILKGVWKIWKEDDSIKPDAVNSPKHYSVFENVEAIQVIASSMTQDQFYGYCLGNILKYRLRAGGKDDVMQELGKADKYQELYTKHKHLCRG
jgi:hypothetical protein